MMDMAGRIQLQGEVGMSPEAEVDIPPELVEEDMFPEEEVDRSPEQGEAGIPPE